MGAEVSPSRWAARPQEAVSEAIRDWVTNVRDTYYLLGSAVGPHPYPLMVRTSSRSSGRKPTASPRRLRPPARLRSGLRRRRQHAIGMFHPFVADKTVTLVGVEAAGRGLETGKHAASLAEGRIGVLHGTKSYLLQDGAGQIRETHSISAGLDYPGVGRSTVT